jgi:hypothetical protein
VRLAIGGHFAMLCYLFFCSVRISKFIVRRDSSSFVHSPLWSRCRITSSSPEHQTVCREFGFIARVIKPTWCTFHSLYWELKASTRFEHYFLILRRLYTNGIWYHNNVTNLIYVHFTITILCLNPLHVSVVKRPSSGDITLAVLAWVAYTCSCWLVVSCGSTGLLGLRV